MRKIYYLVVFLLFIYTAGMPHIMAQNGNDAHGDMNAHGDVGAPADIVFDPGCKMISALRDINAHGDVQSSTGASDPGPAAFEMRELYRCPSVQIHSMSTPMVADLDGDGRRELIACGCSTTSWKLGKNLYVFDGETGSPKYTIFTNDYHLQGQFIAIADVDHDGFAEIFLLEKSGLLRSFNYNGTNRWVYSGSIAGNYVLCIADMNNDGTPELVCGPNIFSTTTNECLLQFTMEGNGTGFGAPNSWETDILPYYMYALADMDGDSTLEMCAGNTIYKIDLPTGDDGNDAPGDGGAPAASMTVLRQAGGAPLANIDGQTFVADFDGDGDLDVCVIGTTHDIGRSNPAPPTMHTVNPYVWDGQTSEIIAYKSLPINNSHGPSMPLCADLDGDGGVEMTFSVYNLGLFSYSYDATQPGNMNILHSYAPYGETTGMTAFDLNQDRHTDIIYRNADSLYILDGATLDRVCEPIAARSGTMAEYPIVADVDGDGHAEILVACANGAWSGNNPQGTIVVMRGGDATTSNLWCSARKVWNEWTYNAVNINEDMTVPRYRFDKATLFPNGERPFNNFLCQTPYMDPEGEPFIAWEEIVIDTFAVVIDSIGWHDSTYRATGTYYYAESMRLDTLTATGIKWAATGCDSLEILHLTVTGYPDNVMEVECEYRADVSIEMRELFRCDSIHSMTTPYVGDIDGDGVPEIIASTYYYDSLCGTDTPCGTQGATMSTGFKVFNGRTGELKLEFSTPQYCINGQSSTIANVDGDSTSEIFVLCSDMRVRCYNHDGTLRWTSDSVDRRYIVQIADINCDSIAELVCGPYIFRAADGVLLLHGDMEETGMGFGAPNGVSSLTGKEYYLYALADMDNDGDLEMCAGNTIYKIFLDTLCGTQSATMTVWRQADDTMGHLAINHLKLDGQTVVVDFDGDGDLDVCVLGDLHSQYWASNNFPHDLCLYVWDGQTSEVIAYDSVPNHHNSSASIPVCSDLDGDGLPEITFALHESMYSYYYAPSHPSRMNKRHNHYPFAGTVGFNIFDLNQDGNNEIIYRGTDMLYISDATALTDIIQETSYSGGIAEYPVVADANNDGHAEILVAHAYQPWAEPNILSKGYGCISVYGSSVPGVWSTARRVWNQWAYNTLAINEDLTVPRYHFNPTEVFPNGKRRFNNWLCQMPYIDYNGDNISPAADLTVLNSQFTIPNPGDDSVVFDIEYQNIGSCNLIAPHGITIYKNNYRGEVLWVDTVNRTLTPALCGTDTPCGTQGATMQTLRVPISVFCGLNYGDSIVIAINDMGSGIAQHGNQYPECDTTNNTAILPAPVYSIYTDTAVVACDSYTWNGITYTTSGIFNSQFSILNSLGCDSIITLHLTIHNSTSSQFNATTCDSMTWNGITYTTSGNKSQTFTNSVGCDSVATMHLTILHSSTSDMGFSVCDSYTWLGTTYTTTGDKVKILVNSLGCDSTITLHLTVNYSSSGDTTVTACDSYIWHGSTYATSGNKVKTFTNQQGCDSIVTLHLTIRNSNYGDDTASACDSYTWNGTTYTTSGNKVKTLTNIYGCDSTVTLHLTIKYSNYSVIRRNECDSFPWFGNTYTASCSTTTTVTNSQGCDSTLVLYLTINHSNTGDTFAVACDSFSWWHTDFTDNTDYATHRFVGGNAVGCDSVVTLHLTVNRSTTGDTFAVACDSFTRAGAPTSSWANDTTFIISGDYVFVTQSMASCDSTVTLHLTVNHSTTGDTLAVVCDSFYWRGETYFVDMHKASPYMTPNSVGCDSVVTLHLTVNRSTTGDTFAVACDSFSWWHTDFTDNTDYATHRFVGGNAVGCDSVVTLHLTVNRSTTGDTFAVACDSFTRAGAPTSSWANDTTFIISGDYVFVTQSMASCDSTVTLHLTVNHSTTGDTLAVVCDSFTWWNTNYTNNTNTPIHVYTNTLGCDSLVTLHLTINQSTAGDTIAEACNTFTWHGTTYTSSGIHNFTSSQLHNIVGCDSTVTLHLTINHCSTRDTLVADSLVIDGRTITDNDTVINGYDTLIVYVCYTIRETLDTTACNLFAWRGMTFLHDTIMSDTILKTDGCDSITTLNLTINHCSTTMLTVCDSMIWHGVTYTTSGEYYDGTDTLVLTVNYSSTGDTFAVACDSFSWWHTDFTDNTDYATHRFVGGNAVGCDSLVTLHLTVNRSTTGDTFAVACDSFYWWNTNYSNSTNTPIHVYTNTIGCDSTVTLHLTVNHSTTGDTFAVVCDSFYWWNTNYSNSTNTPIHVYTNTLGCDSVVTLHLTINQSTAGDTFAVVCDSFTRAGAPTSSWANDTTFIISGDYVFVTQSMASCDSTVTLHLTVNHSTTGDTLAVVCDSFYWRGETYFVDMHNASQSSLEIGSPYMTPNSVGCDSLVTLHLTVNHSTMGDTIAEACNTFTWHGTTYTSSGIHNFTSSQLHNIVGCDSTVTLHLTINHCSTRDTLVADSLVIDGRTITDNDTVINGYDTLIVNICHTIREVVNTTACNLFAWRGMTFVHDTVVSDTILKTDGCDSITTLNLTINHCSTTMLTVCDSMIWHGVTYTTSGEYYDGTDTLVLTVNYSSVGDTFAVVCDSFYWRGETYFVDMHNASQSSLEIGSPYMLVNDAGCDSLVTLHLTVNHSSVGDTFAVVCDSFYWRGETLFTDMHKASPYMTLNSVGCDSLVTLHLTVNHSNSYDTTVYACDSYTWHDSTYTSNAEVIWPQNVAGIAIPIELLNTAGCDSTVRLHLTVNYSTHSDTTIVSCDSMLWFSHPYYSSTDIPTHLGFTTDGCDSLLLLHLMVNYSSVGDTFAVVCDSFYWRGINYTTAGTQLATMTNSVGCDSLVILHLTVNYFSTGDTFAVACDSFYWRGEMLLTDMHKASPYMLVNDAGCDSLVTLHLTVNHSSAGDTIAEACNSFTWHDSTYTANTVVTWPQNIAGIANPVEQLNVAGCDSVTTLYLTINHCSTNDTFAVDSLVIDGITYTDNDTLINGYDTLIINICHTVRRIIDTTVCDLFNWRGTSPWINDTVAIDTVRKADGCDSITTINLTVNHSSTGDTFAVVCDSISWHGTSYTTTGTQLATITNSVGCDSLLTLHLTVKYSTTGDTFAVACDSFYWRGETLFTDMHKASPYMLVNDAGCDSLVTLHLTVNHSSTGDTIAYACESFLWHGTTYTSSGIHNFTSSQLHNSVGCDSVVTLHLTIHHISYSDMTSRACDSLTWNGITYTIDGDYQQVLTSRLPSHCDSIVTLHLSFIHSVSSDITDSFCAGTSYHFAGNDITSGGVYYNYLSTAEGCDSTVQLFLTMLTPPAVSIDHEYDCDNKLQFLHANANVDHISWSSSEGWPDEWGSPHSRNLTVSVERPVVMILTADYNDYPTCPNSASVTLHPIVKPQAQMQVSPEFLTTDDMTLTALAHCRNENGRQWYIDGVEVGHSERITYDANSDADSVIVTLIAYNKHCTDTVEQIIYVRRSTIWAPNVFTPKLSTNSTFDIVYTGIIEYELDIFTRQGLHVYHKETNERPWDGTHNGIPCPQASYAWIVRYRSIVDPKNWHTMKGTVTILR